MKILLVTQNFYPEIGSGANRLKNLYIQLSKRHDVEFFVSISASKDDLGDVKTEKCNFLN